LNADLIAGEKHLYFAVGKALWAIAAGRNIANDPEIENPLFTSACSLLFFP